MSNDPETTAPASPYSPPAVARPDTHPTYTHTPHTQTHMQTRPWEHEPSPHQCPLLVPNHLGEPCPSPGHIPFIECLFGFSSTL